MSKLSIIAVTYGHSYAQVLHFLTSLQLQTEPDWDCFLVHDGPMLGNACPLSAVSHLNDRRIKYVESPERRGLWGHPNRKWILETEELAEFVTFTNADNAYFPVYVEYMLTVAARDKADIVVNSIVHNYPNVMGNNEPPYSILVGHPHLNRADFMSYIMKTELARKVGFNHVDFTGQDGMLVQEAMSWFPDTKVGRVNSIVGVHN